MSRWTPPMWAQLVVAVALPTAVGTWRVQATKTALESAQTEMRAATMARLDAVYYEVCAIRQAIEAKSISKVCGADGRPDLLPVVSRSYAMLPEEPVSPLVLAYLGIVACAVGSVCLLLFASRFGAWADRRQLEERVASLERWREAECPRCLLPDKLPPDEEMTA